MGRIGYLWMRSSPLALVAAAVIGVPATTAAADAHRAFAAVPSGARSQAISQVSGIAESGNALGNPRAPVTIQWFGDLECPICRMFAVGALDGIIRKYVRAGRVRIVYRSMETATLEPPVFREQQTAALAAGRQHRMWYFLELFYREQGEEDSGYVTPAYLEGLAKQVPRLDVPRWERERHDHALVKQVARDESAARKEGFNGTPSFLIGKTGGRARKLTEFTTAQLERASALFEPVIEGLLHGSRG